MKKDWCICYRGGRVTADVMYSTAYTAETSWNYTFWEHERSNKLLVEARAELNDGGSLKAANLRSGHRHGKCGGPH